MIQTLNFWLKNPERFLMSGNERDLAKFKANLVSALTFYSKSKEDIHRETHQPAESTGTVC